MRRPAPMLCGVLLAGMLTAPGAVAALAANNAGPSPSSPAGATTVATRKAATPKKRVTQAAIKSRKKVQAKTASDSTSGAPTDRASVPTGGQREANGKSPSPRTLDEITIQGDIPVPQVLFITARDQRRFLGFQHGRYLQTSQRIGETTVFPTWISVANGVEPPVQEPPR